MHKRIYVIDGNKSSTLEEFAEEMSRVLGVSWRGHLDAFNDILAGGFGTPDEGFVLVWQHADKSRAQLGYGETVRQLERRLQQCHTLSRAHVAQQLEAARQQRGPTVFDWLVEIIQEHDDIELQFA